MLWSEVVPGFSFISRWGDDSSYWMLLSVRDDMFNGEDEDDYVELEWLVTDSQGVRIDHDWRAKDKVVWMMDEHQTIGEAVHAGRKSRIG